MSYADKSPANNDGWRFSAPIPRLSGRSASDSSEPRYSASLAKKVRELMDGDVARFQVGDSCCMILRIGNDLYVRPFGENSELRVNDVPATGMTRITKDDCLQIGRRALLMRKPRREDSSASPSVEELVEEPEGARVKPSRPPLPNFFNSDRSSPES